MFWTILHWECLFLYFWWSSMGSLFYMIFPTWLPKNVIILMPTPFMLLVGWVFYVTCYLAVFVDLGHALPPGAGMGNAKPWFIRYATATAHCRAGETARRHQILFCRVILMDLLIILTYVAFAWAMFKIFKIPVNKWTIPTAAWVEYLLSAV